MNYHSQKSFTILELLIVIAIIAILAGIVLVSLSDSRQRAWEARGMQFYQTVKSGLVTDLVGEWSFDNATNPGRDDSGNNNDGTVDGATWTSNGKVRGALQFDGVDDYVSCPKSGLLNFGTSDFTIAFWINKQAGGKEYPGAISKNGDPGGFRVRIDRSSAGTNPTLEIWDDVDWTEYFPTKATIKEGSWHHVVITADRDNVASFYINGELREKIDISGTGNVNISNSNGNFILGDDTWCRSEVCGQFDGMLDEIQIYKKFLTVRQVQKLYAEGISKYFAKK